MRLQQQPRLLRHAAVPALLMLAPAAPPPVGSMHTCTVKRLEAYGAFCSIEGFSRDGLLHISQMDPDGGRAPSVASMVAIGDRLRVHILDVDRTGKVSLTVVGVRQPEAAPAALQQRRQEPALGRPPSADELERMPCVSLSFSRASGSGGQNVRPALTAQSSGDGLAPLSPAVLRCLVSRAPSARLAR